MNQESNIQLLASFIKAALPSQLEAGISTVPTLEALQTLRSRKFCSHDLDEDDHIDMVKRSLNNNIYIRNVTSPIFTATLCKEAQIQVLEKWCEENLFRRAFLDATGNIVRKISGQTNVLHHVLLIQVHVANDKGATAFNLAELITTCQTSNIISEFLKCFLRFAEEKSKRKMMWFHEIVTDKSFANIGAILQAFNDMTLSRYLETCWNILMNDDKPTLKKLVVVRLCSSHTTKTMMDEIRKHFKNKTVALTICSIIGNMFNIKRFNNLLKYIVQVLFSFMSPFRGPEMNKVRMECSELLQSLHQDESTPLSEFEEIWPEGNPSQTHEKHHGSIYSNSKFYKYFLSAMNEFKIDEVGDENPFFSPQFAHMFVKNHLSYLPLWTNVMSCLRDENQPRANNGAIEGYNNLHKRRVKEAAQVIGSFGRIKCGRYVEFQSEQIDLEVKKIMYQIPARSTPKTKNKRPTQENISENNIMQSKENYKKRTPRTSKKHSTFFTHQIEDEQSEEESPATTCGKRFKSSGTNVDSESDEF